MKIKKLDNRFKLKKAGIATYMADLTIFEFDIAERLLTTAYGPGHYIPRWNKAPIIRNQHDWFFGYQQGKTRFYFRREEQATYLALAMS